MLRLAPLVLALAVPAFAQDTPSPNGKVNTDMSVMPGAPGTTGKPAETPPSPDAASPPDVRTTPPDTTTQAPPATNADTPSAESKAKGRAKPSSTAKTPPRG